MKLASFPSKKIRYWLFLLAYFVTVASGLSLFASGTIESEDGWLYLTVARNIYYHGRVEAAPNEYATRQNVNMNSLLMSDGTWRAAGGLGYSIVMVPAVALSDVYHRVTGTPVPTHFPLETDWSLLFFASFTNCVLTGLLAVVMVLYGEEMGWSRRSSLGLSVATIFLTNLWPLSKFGFAHSLFNLLLVTTFVLVKKYGSTRRWAYLAAAMISFFGLIVSYNFSWYLVVIPLALYWALVSGLRWRVPSRWQLFYLGLVLVGAWLLVDQEVLPLIDSINFFPSVLIEGVWGLLFSAGKSIFIYSPPLVLLLLFWHRLRVTLRPELISFGLLAALYLFFYGLSNLYDPNRGVFPIWYGGAVWGPRYLSALIPFAMILVWSVVKEFTVWQRRLIWWPVIAVSLGIQVLGIANPYQVQYRGLPYNVFVADHEVIHYDYASFIPRFSPVLTMAKELCRRLLTFKDTVNHGSDQVVLYDGFDLPYYAQGMSNLSTIYRGFRREGYISWQRATSDQSPTTTLELDLYHYPGSVSSASASLVIATDTQQQRLSLPPEGSSKLSLTVPHQPNQELQLQLTEPHVSLDLDTPVIYIRRMSINGRSVNLGTLDYPYLDSFTVPAWAPYQYNYFGKNQTDLWQIWNMRARVYENTIDWWWVRFRYYWDLPQRLITLLLIANVTIVLTSASLAFNMYKKI